MSERITTTLQVAGQAPVTVDNAAVRHALRVVKGRAGRERAAADPLQSDLEETTGVGEVQERRETEAGGIAGDRLRSIVERVERLEEERKTLADDIKDIRTEAKSAGFDVPTINAILKLRKKDPAEVAEAETLLDLYRRSLGM